MNYIDSNIFIYPVIYNENVSGTRKAKDYLLKIAKGKLKASTATLTWDELVWIVQKISNPRNAIAEGNRFLKFPHLKILDVDHIVLQRAQELIEEYDLKPRDAIHAATALVNGINKIISDDEDFDVIKELKRIPIR
jgi:predicted nucleic acid-binding protein